MKILFLNGSPRGERSNTLKLSYAFLKNIKENADYEIEYVDISKSEIKHCLGCFSCWTKTPGKCILKDDMTELFLKYIKSDIIIWSIPLYTYGMPSKIKAFSDRLLPAEHPFMKIKEDGTIDHKKRFDLSNQKHLLISTCGFPTIEKNYEALLKQFEIMFQDRYDSLIFPEGEILRVPELEERMKPYLEFISRAGDEYFSRGIFSEETLAKINKPLIPAEKFIQMANESWGIEEI